jgi:hypothetical protein
MKTEVVGHSGEMSRSSSLHPLRQVEEAVSVIQGRVAVCVVKDITAPQLTLIPEKVPVRHALAV